MRMSGLRTAGGPTVRRPGSELREVRDLPPRPIQQAFHPSSRIHVLEALQCQHHEHAVFVEAKDVQVNLNQRPEEVEGNT